MGLPGAQVGDPLRHQPCTLRGCLDEGTVAFQGQPETLAMGQGSASGIAVDLTRVLDVLRPWHGVADGP